MPGDHDDRRSTPPGRGPFGLPRPVWLLGLTSLLTDTASEAIYPLLPLYLTRVLGASAVSLGLIEGIAEGANSILKIVSGRVSDRWRVRKPIVVAGYGLSSAVRPLIALVGSWPQLLAVRFLDRVGKGVRGAPRDAILAACATPATRGRVFGFHRAMDHAGAVVGPLLASLFLLVDPGQYRLLFAATILPGALSVWILTRIPSDAAAGVAPRADAGLRRGSAGPAGAHEGVRAGGAAPERRGSAAAHLSWRSLPRGYYALLGVLAVFTLGNSADAFLLLRLSDMGVAPAAIPLLWAALHVVKALMSVWGGITSDRFGRRLVIGGGWLVYALVYAGFAWSESAGALVASFLVYGLYYGLSEGVEKALVADLTPPASSATAFGLYNGVLGIGALLASVVFGVVWKSVSPEAAFGLGAGLALGATLLLFVFVREPPRRDGA